jgi:hypothetical protein
MEHNGLFKELYEESFPSISATTRAKFRSFLAKSSPDYKWLYAPALRGVVSQGDIVVSIPAFFFDDGKVRTSAAPCPLILLEHTCDMSIDGDKYRNNNYVIAPLFPFSVIAKSYADPSALRNNSITHKIYFESIPSLDEPYIADLNMISSVSAKWFHEAIKSSAINRVASLSDDGFYFLLAKLTVHMLRSN